MTVAVTLTVTPTAPAHGATVTATYVVTGNDPGPGQTIPVNGDVTVGATPYHVSATITTPGTPALPETYSAPKATGLAFTATSDPKVWTAVVP